MLPTWAVTSVLPIPAGVSRPVESMVAAAVLELTQVTPEVIGSVDPSEKVPVSASGKL